LQKKQKINFKLEHNELMSLVKGHCRPGSVVRHRWRLPHDGSSTSSSSTSSCSNSKQQARGQARLTLSALLCRLV